MTSPLDFNVINAGEEITGDITITFAQNLQGETVDLFFFYANDDPLKMGSIENDYGSYYDGEGIVVNSNNQITFSTSIEINEETINFDYLIINHYSGNEDTEYSGLIPIKRLYNKPIDQPIPFNSLQNTVYPSTISGYGDITDYDMERDEYLDYETFSLNGSVSESYDPSINDYYKTNENTINFSDCLVKIIFTDSETNITHCEYVVTDNNGDFTFNIPNLDNCSYETSNVYVQCLGNDTIAKSSVAGVNISGSER